MRSKSGKYSALVNAQKIRKLEIPELSYLFFFTIAYMENANKRAAPAEADATIVMNFLELDPSVSPAESDIIAP